MKFIYYLVFFFWYLLSLLPLRVLFLVIAEYFTATEYTLLRG